MKKSFTKDRTDAGLRKVTNHNIVVINQYYPPDRSATANTLEKIVRAISKNHCVYVISGRPSYLTLKTYKWKLLSASKEKKVKILRVGSTAFPRYLIIKRMLNYVTYLILALPLALLLKSDLILSMTDPPLAGLVGAISSKLKNKPFVYYIQDLHPDMAIRAGMIKVGILSRFWQIIHMFVLSAADRIIVIGNDMRNRIIAKGIYKNKISVIGHGVSDFNKTQTKLDNDLIKTIKKNYSFTFMHAGNIGNYGAFDQLIKAIKQINRQDIGFIFVGEGQLKEKLISLSSGISNIEFYPYQPKAKLYSVLKACDVHVITVKNGMEGLVVPSKLYPILGANKPILAICPSTSNTAIIIDKYKCGLIADPDSINSIAKAISKFVDEKEQLHEYESQSRLAANQFSQDHSLQLVSKEIDKLL